MKYTLVLVGSLLTFLVFGKTEYSKEDKKTLNNADAKFEIGDYHGAGKLYQELVSQHPSDDELNYKVGVCHFEMAAYRDAEKHFDQIKGRVSHEVLRYKAALAHLNQRFGVALHYYNEYKVIPDVKKDLSVEQVDRLVQKVRFATDAQKNAKNIAIDNLGSNINTAYDEYVPLTSADGYTLLYTSRKPDTKGGQKDPTGRYYEDVYMLTKENNGWSSPKKLNDKINTNTNDACVGLSADGQVLFLFRTNDDLVSGDLYESRMGLYDWEDPVRLGSNINSEYVETSASITSDDKTLYFSSDRPGGFGGKDIYKVERLPNGEWGGAKNLGPTVNTAFDEDAPFIHSDNKTLYFSSQAHQNMGGYDVFKTKMNNDGKWTMPENLGYPINTVNDDIFFVLAADGKIGYYSSSRVGGYGGQDLYKVVLIDESAKLHVLKGSFQDALSAAPIGATITLIDNDTKEVQGIYKSRTSNGRFILLVQKGKTYQMVMEADGYLSSTQDLRYEEAIEQTMEFKLDKK